jgi:hypothetical protein
VSKQKIIFYLAFDDAGEHRAETLADAIAMATAPADIYAIQSPPSMPAHGQKTLHHWRLYEGRKVSQLS